MSTTVHPDPRLSLERANEVRLRRGALRSDLRRLPSTEARAVLADAIATAPDWLASQDVDVLLEWVPRLYRRTIDKWLAQAQLFERRRLREVSERQRRLLAELLTGPTTTKGERVAGQPVPRDDAGADGVREGGGR